MFLKNNNIVLSLPLDFYGLPNIHKEKTKLSVQNACDLLNLCLQECVLHLEARGAVFFTNLIGGVEPPWIDGSMWISALLSPRTSGVH